jgi:SAM-dependent methyltransferase
LPDMATVSAQYQHCPLCDDSEIKPYRQVPRNYADMSYQLHLGQCSRCNFVFLLNDPHIEYDEHYLNLEQVTTARDVLARFRAQERIVSIAQFVPPAPEHRFLDIGIGDGLLLSLAESAGYSTFGLDVNPVGVEMARKQYHLQADVRLDPPEKAFPNQQFDVIHMNEVIEHTADPMPLLRWCRKHLNRGGSLVIQTGNLDSLASRIKGADWDYFRPVHVSYFSTRTLSYAVQQAGYEIVRCVTMDWRFKSVLRVVNYLLRHDGVIRALRFLTLYITALPHGIRRSVLVYAV